MAGELAGDARRAGNIQATADYFPLLAKRLRHILFAAALVYSHMPWWRTRETAPADAPVDPHMPVIRLEHVSRVFKGDAEEDTRALDDATVDIARGEYVAVSGPSGCGKSTFLSIIGLLDTPTSGRYWLNGRATDTLSAGERARVRNLDVGLVFQSFNLIGDMTVYENVEYPLVVRGISAADRKQRVTAALDRVGLTARKASSGQPVRRPATTRRCRARDHRPAGHPARRRADGQPRLEERRIVDADVQRAPRGRGHCLRRHA